MQEGDYLGACMFVLRCGRVEDDQGHGLTCKREERIDGSTDRGE